MIIRRYSDLIQIPDYQGRLEYLMLKGKVGEDTFGFDRIFNQMFYTGEEWRQFRRHMIERDCGCDLALKGYEIEKSIILHHMNCLTIDDIRYSTDNLMNPEFVVCVSDQTHKFIHYGIDAGVYTKSKELPVRTQFDTCPWRCQNV